MTRANRVGAGLAANHHHVVGERRINGNVFQRVVGEIEVFQ